MFAIQLVTTAAARSVPVTPVTRNANTRIGSAPVASCVSAMSRLAAVLPSFVSEAISDWLVASVPRAAVPATLWLVRAVPSTACGRSASRSGALWLTGAGLGLGLGLAAGAVDARAAGDAAPGLAAADDGRGLAESAWVIAPSTAVATDSSVAMSTVVGAVMSATRIPRRMKMVVLTVRVLVTADDWSPTAGTLTSVEPAPTAESWSRANASWASAP